MKIYLDDRRTTPEGWVRTYTAADTIDYLKAYSVTHLSLDHDLGQDENGEEFPNGYQVLLWMENEVAINRYVPPDIQIHSANSVGIRNMRAAVESIERYHAMNTEELR